MPLTGTMEEALKNRRGRAISSVPGESDSATVMRSDLMPDPGEPGDYQPNCKLIEQGPHAVIRPHFHVVDQFQVVVNGEGKFGSRVARPMTVHYAAAYTSYGPIVTEEQGLDYMVFRTGIDRGAAYIPEARDRMRDVPRRGQLVGPVKALDVKESDLPAQRAERFMIPVETDGLMASLLWLPGGEAFAGRLPREGGGQFYYVESGSMIFNGIEFSRSGTIYVGPDEAPVTLIAGRRGLELLCLQFPRMRAQEQ